MVYAVDVAEDIWKKRHPEHQSSPAARVLEQRLNDGYARIEAALARGEDVQSWETFWIELLHQYEAEVRDA